MFINIEQRRIMNKRLTSCLTATPSQPLVFVPGAVSISKDEVWI